MPNKHNRKQKETGKSTAVKALRGTVLFYLLIAFEMVYMAGPFAIYFYGIYNPILKFFNSSPALSFLNRFFLPHIARTTTSSLINIHEYVGAFIAIIGFILFLIGAVQIYYSKFTRKGAVTGGLYRFVRHPQYTSFATCGLGLLILWPRYINLFMFITMLFVYYLLAKAEERECETKFGQSYIDYKNKTSMFFPFCKGKCTNSLPDHKTKRALILTGMYIFSLVLAYNMAMLIYNHSVNSLYASYTENSATIAVCHMDESTISEILTIVSENEQTADYINNTENMYLNYILPTNWYAAEIPMNGIEYRSGHASPDDYDQTQYKIILTKAILRASNSAASGTAIFTEMLEREPLLEVWVDLKQHTVTQVFDIPENYKYRGIPVAIF